MRLPGTKAEPILGSLSLTLARGQAEGLGLLLTNGMRLQIAFFLETVV